MRSLALALAAVTLMGSSLLGGAASAAAAGVMTEEFMIPSGDAGISLYIRNKHPAGLTAVKPEQVLLYVHGTSQAGETTFDLPLDGMSWMDSLARHGYDVYLVDIRGYGRSSRPPEMSAPAAANPPVVTTDTAVHDAGAAVDFILQRRHIAKLNLMGWSWGTVTVAAYTAQHNDKVNRLVLYAPVWLRPPGPEGSEKPLGAWQSWTVEAARANLETGAPAAERAQLMPAAWFAQWKAAALATDPAGAKENPPVVRTPNGAPFDARRYWASDRPYYDPGQITVPVLIVHGEWDGLLPSAMSHAVFAKLTRAPWKRFVDIGGGTHFLMLERNRLQLFGEVQLFLDQPDKAS